MALLAGGGNHGYGRLSAQKVSARLARPRAAGTENEGRSPRTEMPSLTNFAPQIASFPTEIEHATKVHRMGINLCNFETRIAQAVAMHWRARAAAAEKEGKKRDQGTRGQVTAGKHLQPLADFFVDVVRCNGIPEPEIHVGGPMLTLPGFFRPTKDWDLVVTHRGELVAAIEFKSQVGSFGNNANNRAEEVIGLGVDLWTAHREGAFGKSARLPFVGYFFLLEDSDKVRNIPRPRTLHFPVFEHFNGASSSYAGRYEVLCRKLVQEKLYTAATVILSKPSGDASEAYNEISEATSVRRFVAELASHVAKVAAS
jgi:type II restriction enzyme